MFYIVLFETKTEGRDGRRIIRRSNRKTDQASQVIQTNIAVLFRHLILCPFMTNTTTRRDR